MPEECPCLLLIDVQKAFDQDEYWGERNNPDAEQRIAELLAHWRERDWPVAHVWHASTEKQSPLRPDQPGYAVKPEAAPLAGEVVFTKTVNSAFIGTELEAHLRQRGIQRLVVTGLTTDHCVSTSVRMAGNLGFDVFLVAEATATHGKTAPDGEFLSADYLHRAQLASLHQEFCQVVSVQEALAQS
jgi:nicotinamidase-related amidase